MREKLFLILDDDSEVGRPEAKLYKYIMLMCIVLSLLPLTVHKSYILVLEPDCLHMLGIIFDKPIKIPLAKYFGYFEWPTTIIFIIDYLVRFITADFRDTKKSAFKAFLRYPFTKFALIDLISILPTVLEAFPAFKMARVTRLLRITRVFKVVRLSENLLLIEKAWINSKGTLGVVIILAICYILVSALIIFNVEDPRHFRTFFQAVYWATISLTTVGYGDIYPKTQLGQAVAMLSSLIGCAVIALPSGIITAGYIKALEDEKNKVPKTEDNHQGEK